MSKKLLYIVFHVVVSTLAAQEVPKTTKRSRIQSRYINNRYTRKSGKYRQDRYTQRNRRPQYISAQSYEQSGIYKRRIEHPNFYRRSTYNSNFIYDKYTRKRGVPKMLLIFCATCDTQVMSYQKDGPGRLLRCYLDRIHSPEWLKNKQYEEFKVNTFAQLACENCACIIGKPMEYRTENRPAYRMIKNAFYFKEEKSE